MAELFYIAFVYLVGIFMGYYLTNKSYLSKRETLKKETTDAITDAFEQGKITGQKVTELKSITELKDVIKFLEELERITKNK